MILILQPSLIEHGEYRNLKNFAIDLTPSRKSLVKFFRIIPEFSILRLTFHRKSASKY